MKHRLIGLAALAVVAVPLVAPTAQAAETRTVCTSGCDFTTISAAVTAAVAGDTIQVVGALSTTGTTNINKAVTVTGASGASVTQTSSAITFLLSAAGSSLTNLTITSNAPYAREFVQVGASNVSVTGNTIYGPAQPLPMSGWVGNRGLVTQGGISGLTFSNNTLHSMRSGAYLNPNGTGTISNNTLYNTKGDFLIDNSGFTFNGNKAGDSTKPSEWSFVIFAGTNAALYTDIKALSRANNYMTVWDQRDNETYVGPAFNDLRALMQSYVNAGRLSAKVFASLDDRLTRAQTEAEVRGSELQAIVYLEQFVARAQNQIKGDAQDLEVRDIIVREGNELLNKYRALEESENQNPS
jgi:hypothetical protein